MKADAHPTAKFLDDQVLSKVGCLLKTASNCSSHFMNEVIVALLVEFLVIHCKSTPYYPQANG